MKKIIKWLYRSQNSEFSCWVLNKIADFKTILIFDKKEKQKKRLKLLDTYKSLVFGYQVRNTAKSIGEGFWCGGFSQVSNNTILKDHVCMNGLKVNVPMAYGGPCSGRKGLPG